MSDEKREFMPLFNGEGSLVNSSTEPDVGPSIIAMVREHDATAPKPTTPADVLQLRVEVLERSLKERTEELNISRGLAKRAIQLLGGDS